MRIVAVAVGVVLLAGCGTGAPAGSAEDPEGGVAGEWVLVDGVPLVAGYPVTLQVGEGRVGGTAACNSYGGEVTISGDRFGVADVARTEMGCPDPGVHDSEEAYLEALLAVERYERADAQLILLGPDVELRFDPVAAEEDAALAGTEWQLEALVTGSGPEGTASSTMADATLHLHDDGSFDASDGCNDLTGGWAVDGDALRLTEVVTSDVACPDLDAQIEHIQAVLLAEPTVQLQGRRLLVTAGERALDYRAS